MASGEIEAVLAGQPGVGDCVVVASPEPVLGEAICACVVPAGDQPPTLTELRTSLAERLARHKLPDELCVLDSLPRSAIGKIDRAALAGLVGEADVPRERLRSRGPEVPTGQRR